MSDQPNPADREKSSVPTSTGVSAQASQRPVAAENSLSDTETAIETAVNNWINSHVRNSPISAVVEAWNYLHSVLPQLKENLKKELGS